MATKSANPHGNKGKVRSAETRLKDRLVKLGKVASTETKEKMSKIHKYIGTGKWMLGKKHSEETKRKMSESRKGSNNPLWKGGITPIHLMIRTSKEYKLWREAVFARDNWTCVWCGARCSKGNTVVLHADHIKPFAYFPELRLAIDNGRTLCAPCHRTTDTYGNKNIYGH